MYAVKLATNPCGTRILVNELVAARLAWSVGLETPTPALVTVGAGLDAPPGVHFGSEFVASWGSQLWLPAAAWERVANPGDLIGAYVFDAWAGNVDARQVVFRRTRGSRCYRLLLIDNGACFGGRAWRFHGGGIPQPARHRFAYLGVRSWGDLEPWLTNIERLPKERIESAVADVPGAWFAEGDRRSLPWLAACLVDRRSKIREIIARVVAGGDHPFLRWRSGPGPQLVDGVGGGFDAAA